MSFKVKWLCNNLTVFYLHIHQGNYVQLYVTLI